MKFFNSLFVRALRVVMAVFLVLTASAFTTPATWENKPVVQTKFGLIRGHADQDTWCWKGIPYAAPPVGALRWKAPVDPQPWSGIRNARRFSNSASQSLPILGHIGSEDCLYLNIWRPASDETGLPVYLFIHGGGNSIGTGSSRDYYGNAMAEKSHVVFISVNFRLGVMGWFRHPAVTGKGSPQDQSGNFGTLDLIKALEWVQGNIAAFGGDPGNVTIAGESGGAMDVLSLLTSPVAKGLFHRAVVESGLRAMRSVTDAVLQSNTLLMNLLVADGHAPNLAQAAKYVTGMTPSEIDSYLRSKSPAELMKRIPTMVGGMANWPCILTDGYVLPEEGYHVFSQGNWANQVPLLIGVNKDEMKLFRFLLKDPAPGTDKYALLSRYQSLVWRANGLDSIAIAMTSKTGMPPVYAYRFDWGSPDENGVSVLPGNLGSTIGACHYAEIPFFLGGKGNQLSVLTGNTYSRANQPGREKLTGLCMSYLANFARTGDPNGESLPTWKAWDPTPGSVKLIHLDAGLTDLRISYGYDTVTLQSIWQLAIAELTEPELGEVLKSLSGSSMFGTGK